MRNDLWSLLTENREKLVCALAALVLALTVQGTVRSWRTVEPLGPPKGTLRAPEPLPQAPFPDGPLARYWDARGRDPFQASGQQVVARDSTQLPFPPLPPVPVLEPPPADPWPSLYRDGVVRSEAHLLTLAAPPGRPRLKSGRPCTIEPRPYDIVQAPGDPKPIEGSIRREDDGRIWFYYNKPRGFGHPKNPLVIANLIVLKRKTTTVEQAYQERAEEAGQNADAHFALAQECIDGDLMPQAEAELRRTLELNPQHRAAYLKLADLFLAQGNRDGEIGVYEAALATGAHSPEIRERLGRRCFELGLLGLAYDHFAAGFQAAANASIADVLDKRRPLPAAPMARRLVRQAAEVRIMQGRLDEATRLLEPLAQAAPDDPVVRNVQALDDLLAGRYEQAAESLKQVVDAPTPPASALNNLGALLCHQGRYEQALERFQACRAAVPTHTKAALNAVLALAALGRLDEAEALLSGVSASRPSLAGQLVVGYLRERKGRLDEAIAAYQGALQVDQACFYALCGLARCHLAKGELSPAIERAASARLLRPDDPRALRVAGTSLFRDGQFAEATDVLRRLAGRPGASPRDLTRLGIASLRLVDRRRGAAALFDRALEDPRHREPYALIGKAYLAYVGVAGTEEQAEQLFRTAQTMADAPDASQYAARALRRIFVARREEFTALVFQGEATARLPEGWRALGRGLPTPMIRQDTLRFAGRAPTATLRQVVRTEPLTQPAGQGFVRAFTRFEARVEVPLTNQAAVGASLGVGSAKCQVALRTQLQPVPSRRLAWRIVRDDQPTPWVDLPGAVAVERFKLGLGLSERGDRFVDVLLDGRTVGAPVEFRELQGRRDEVEIGLFAAPEAQQECLFTVREVEIVWKKAAAEGR